jgi:hypothetical protein
MFRPPPSDGPKVAMETIEVYRHNLYSVRPLPRPAPLRVRRVAWKEPPELKARTINRVRAFLKAQPLTAARSPKRRDRNDIVAKQIRRAHVR